MSLIDLHLDQVPDLEVVPVGEYTLTIQAAEVRNSANTGGQYLYIQCAIDGEPNAYPVSHVLMFPTVNDDEATRNNRLRRIKRFVEAIGLDPAEPFDVEDLIGKQFSAVLDIEEDEEYGTRNRIKRIM